MYLCDPVQVGDRKVDAIEARLAVLLRAKLESSADAESMFRVFARFSPLLARTRVRAAVKEFQLRLLATVGDAVAQLQSMFAHKYEASAAAAVAAVVAGAAR